VLARDGDSSKGTSGGGQEAAAKMVREEGAVQALFICGPFLLMGTQFTYSLTNLCACINHHYIIIDFLITNTTTQVCVSVACGGDHTIIARADRCVLSTGRNHKGQLGLGQLSLSELRALGIPKEPKVSIPS
jgi:hypothetical protein